MVFVVGLPARSRLSRLPGSAEMRLWPYSSSRRGPTQALALASAQYCVTSCQVATSLLMGEQK